VGAAGLFGALGLIFLTSTDSISESAAPSRIIGTRLDDDRRRDCDGDTGLSDPAAAFADERVGLWEGLLAEEVGTAVVALRDREDERAGRCASASDATTMASSSELPGGGTERLRVFWLVLAFFGLSILRFFCSGLLYA